jgi:hypothetical protein
MKVKLLLFGEAVTIPHTSIGLGVGLISVWMNGNGFTSASNDLGALGYIFLETQEVDIGDLDSEGEEIFSTLHSRVVGFEIKPNVFAISGGIARISMTVSLNEDGALREKKIEFLAEDCKGIAVVSNALNFSTTMFQMESRLADLDTDTIVPEADVLAIADAAPSQAAEVPS